MYHLSNSSLKMKMSECILNHIMPFHERCAFIVANMAALLLSNAEIVPTNFHQSSLDSGKLLTLIMKYYGLKNVKLTKSPFNNAPMGYDTVYLLS